MGRPRADREDQALNAAPDAQLRLLDLQELDSSLDRLAQRRRTLPELAEIEQAEARLAELRDLVVAAETERADIALAERKIDNDVDVVRQRVARDQGRLDSGQVGSPKELENLQHELVSLARRQSELEDLELEQMELREAVEQRLAALQAEAADVSAQLAAAVARRDAAWAEIDAESVATASEREQTEGALREVAGDLLDLYAKLRASSGGVGAAALWRGQCTGCHLSLPPSDLGRIKSAPDDEVLRCEECRRILVRKPDSGLV